MIQYISAIAIYFLINWLVYMVVDKWELIPDWLNYKPYICRTCLTFWVSAGVAVGMALLGWWIACIATGILALANLIAMLIDERNTTIL